LRVSYVRMTGSLKKKIPLPRFFNKSKAVSLCGPRVLRLRSRPGVLAPRRWIARRPKGVRGAARGVRRVTERSADGVANVVYRGVAGAGICCTKVLATSIATCDVRSAWFVCGSLLELSHLDRCLMQYHQISSSRVDRGVWGLTLEMAGQDCDMR
jgi:hypothetical protein